MNTEDYTKWLLSILAELTWFFVGKVQVQRFSVHKPDVWVVYARGRPLDANGEIAPDIGDARLIHCLSIEEALERVVKHAKLKVAAYASGASPVLQAAAQQRVRPSADYADCADGRQEPEG